MTLTVESRCTHCSRAGWALALLSTATLIAVAVLFRGHIVPLARKCAYHIVHGPLRIQGPLVAAAAVSTLLLGFATISCIQAATKRSLPLPLRANDLDKAFPSK